jgi:hypothetical protein
MTQLKLTSMAIAILWIPVLLWSQQPLGGMDFHINVLDGEDGVNIIKKKTAVKPVIEVKDKNDLPIAGVAVVIGLGAAGVFDSGSHEATVVTNANGIATAPDFRPIAKGSFTIQVRATYQGLTQTAAIRQTNFATVADALKAGKTPGSSQASNGSQSSSGLQASNAAPQASSAVASGGGHGALVAVIVAGGAAAGVGAAYAAGVLGKSDSGTTTTTNTGVTTNSCTAQVGANFTAALSSLASSCEGNSSSSCSTAATNAANAMANFCAACGVNNLSAYTGVSVSQEYSSFQGLGASASSLSNLESTCH